MPAKMVENGLPGQRRQSNPAVADATLPFRVPDAFCNARLNRASGYCRNTAGEGTDHEGIGRCRLHGGLSPKQEHADGPLGLFRAAGLEPLINAAETMSRGDSEYLYHVGNASLVLTRTGIIARMADPGVSPKELADLSMALARVDALLAKYTEELDPNSGSQGTLEEGSPVAEELDRLRRIVASS